MLHRDPEQHSASAAWSAMPIVLARLDGNVARLEVVAEKAEKRDWLWGAVTLAACMVMAYLAYKVHVLEMGIKAINGGG